MAGRAKTTPEGLTEQQEAFCLEYLKCNIGTEAYKKAYPASLKWKSTSVEVEASTMLANPKITRRLNQLRKAAADKALLTESRVLKEAARIALADPRGLYDEYGEVLPMSEWSDDAAATVANIETIDFKGVKKIKITRWNKNQALEKLFRHMGMYEQDNKQKAPILANLDKLPSSVQDMIAEKLNAIIGRPSISGPVDTGTGKRIIN